MLFNITKEPEQLKLVKAYVKRVAFVYINRLSKLSFVNHT